MMEGKAGTIHSDVYQAYSDNLRKAVGGVFRSDDYGDKYFELQAQLQSNVSRFAAYKAYHLTEQLKKKREEWTNDDDFKNIAKAMMNTFNRYQAAEYNTATARARTAKQWNDFNADPIANELYPNLRWLPSRSANPREEHQAFYWLVLPKNDLFWQQNQPGNLWNCKCDWEETDAPIDTKELKADDLAKARSEGGGIHANGLEGNPAVTGEIFTQGCTYFQQAGKDAAVEVIKTVRTIVREQFVDLEKHLTTSLGNVLVDNITMIEVSKGSATDKTYFLKQEIASNFDKYIEKLHPLQPENVDLSHNRKNNIFYKRKKQFEQEEGMKVFSLALGEYTFTVKLGKFRKDGSYHLYTITG